MEQRSPTFKRNMSIFRDHARGIPFKDLEIKYELSRARLDQIIRNIERRIKYMLTEEDATSMNDRYRALVKEYSDELKKLNSETRRLIKEQNDKSKILINGLSSAARQMAWFTFDSRTLPDEKLESGE